MKFSEKIVRLRKIRGITQDELASAVGVSRQAVYKWECGQSYPEVMKLLEIKALFGISIDDLLDESYEIALPDRKKRKRINRARATAIEREVEAQVSAAALVETPETEEEITVVEVDATPAIEDSVVEVEEVSEEIVETPSQQTEEATLEEVAITTEEAGAADVAEEVVSEIEESCEVVEETGEGEPSYEEVAPEEASDVAPIAEDEAEVEETPVVAEEAKPEKKRGFFSRLFGRK